MCSLLMMIPLFFFLSFNDYPDHIVYKQTDIVYISFFFNRLLRHHQWEKLSEYPGKEIVVKLGPLKRLQVVVNISWILLINQKGQRSYGIKT